MNRSTFVKSTSGTLLLVTMIYAVSAACGQVTAPCDGNSFGGLDGIWRATTINSQPAMNYPLSTGDRFYSGLIEFETIDTSGLDCTLPESSTGYATAIYALRKTDGSLESKRYVGQFEYLHKRDQVQLTAVGYEVNGTVSQPGTTMTLPSAHTIFGTATVVLVRD